MVVIDSTTDFAVLINENGVPEEDCQEVYYTPGFRVDFSKAEPAVPTLQSQL
jgi:ureidoglycolate lyase